jgi:hypothetical protein
MNSGAFPIVERAEIFRVLSALSNYLEADISALVSALVKERICCHPFRDGRKINYFSLELVDT